MATVDAPELCQPVSEPACAFCPPVRRGDMPAWYPPANTDPGSAVGLVVNNSLTRTKEPFVPARGRRVRWYTCGPTVYDVAHMGHARAYLTFDILRRVMEDSLGYDVEYQLNITDIDDKIILRARRNKLLADYRGAGKPLAEVQADVDAAVIAYDRKMAAKLAELSATLPAGTPSIEVDERAELLEIQQLKARQWAEAQATIDAARGAADALALIDAALEPLAERLDAQLGCTVTDQAVFESHARKYEAEFFDDMAALGVRPPTLLTRVTEYVPEIVAYIETIVAKALAYESNGSVYMDIRALQAAGHDYRKLMPAGAGAEHATEAQMQEGEGALAGGASEKRSRNDFALWKASKPGEPSWPSPWGGGRPGWHIECSAMGSATFGPNMDVHAGGADLKFPHHDNELAQSEAYHGCTQWVNYFLHAGHLHIKGLKMSKSLKNFVTIRQALEQHSARQIRLMFLMQPWDRSMQYSDQTIGEARAVERKLRDFFGQAKALRREPWLAKRTAPSAADAALIARVGAFNARARAALLDNFNTLGVMTEMLALCADAADAMRAAPEAQPGVLAVSEAAVAVTRMLRVFGVAEQDDFGLPLGGGADGADGGGGSREAHVTPYADALVKLRDSLRVHAKGAKDKELLALCDAVRDSVLCELGIRVEDPVGTATDSAWRLDAPDALRREVVEREERRRDKEQASLGTSLATKRKVRRRERAPRASERAPSAVAALRPTCARAHPRSLSHPLSCARLPRRVRALFPLLRLPHRSLKSRRPLRCRPRSSSALRGTPVASRSGRTTPVCPRSMRRARSSQTRRRRCARGCGARRARNAPTRALVPLAILVHCASPTQPGAHGGARPSLPSARRLRSERGQGAARARGGAQSLPRTTAQLPRRARQLDQLARGAARARAQDWRGLTFVRRAAHLCRRRSRFSVGSDSSAVIPRTSAGTAEATPDQLSVIPSSGSL
jgi:cysteinyl-tRNA synthetase